MKKSKKNPKYWFVSSDNEGWVAHSTKKDALRDFIELEIGGENPVMIRAIKYVNVKDKKK